MTILANLTMMEALLAGMGILFLPLILLVTFKSANVGVQAISKGAKGVKVKTLPNELWLILTIPTIAAGYFLLQYNPQLLLLSIAVVAGGFSLKKLINTKSKTWTAAAIVSVIMLFISWDPTWQRIIIVKDRYVGMSPAQSVQEIVERVPELKGDVLTMPKSGSITRLIDHPVRIATPACDDLMVLPKGVFEITPSPGGTYSIITPPTIGVLSELTVHLVPPLRKHEGC